MCSPDLQEKKATRVVVLAALHFLGKRCALSPRLLEQFGCARQSPQCHDKDWNGSSRPLCPHEAEERPVPVGSRCEVARNAMDAAVSLVLAGRWQTERSLPAGGSRRGMSPCHSPCTSTAAGRHPSCRRSQVASLIGTAGIVACCSPSPSPDVHIVT